jgi:hypothetical protein
MESTSTGVMHIDIEREDGHACGAGAFCTVVSNDQWAAVNIPIYQFDSGTVNLFNGPVAIASYSWIA